MKKYSLNKGTNNSLQEVLKTILQKVRSHAFSTVSFKDSLFDQLEGQFTTGTKSEILRTVEHWIVPVDLLKDVKHRECWTYNILRTEGTHECRYLHVLAGHSQQQPFSAPSVSLGSVGCAWGAKRRDLQKSCKFGIQLSQVCQKTRTTDRELLSKDKWRWALNSLVKALEKQHDIIVKLKGCGTNRAGFDSWFCIGYYVTMENHFISVRHSPII